MRRAVLRRDRLARDQARLVEARRARAGSLRGERRLRRARPRSLRSPTSCARSASRSRSSRIPAPSTRSRTTNGPRCTTDDATKLAFDAHARRSSAQTCNGLHQTSRSPSSIAGGMASSPCGEHRGALHVDRVAIALEPFVPRARPGSRLRRLRLPTQRAEVAPGARAPRVRLRRGRDRARSSSRARRPRRARRPTCARSPWNASGVTPKKQRSPANTTSASSTSTSRSPDVWPDAGITSTRSVSRAASVTRCVTWRVPSSSRSSNSSVNAGMNDLYASMRHRALEQLARLHRAEHLAPSGTRASHRRGRRARG